MIKKGLIRLIIFIHEVYIRMRNNELIDMANALSFKLILSIFPFIIFILSSVAVFNLDVSSIVVSLTDDVPETVRQMLSYFINETFDTKHVSLFSSSLFLTLFSASSGLYTLMKGLNRAYDASERRGYIVQRFISLLLVIIFTLLIILSLYVCIFSDKINELIFGQNTGLPLMVINLRSYLITAALIFVMIVIMYMLALVDRPTVKQLIPGTIFTMAAWLTLSKLFNIYVNNFSRYSNIYGSIGALFIFALWLNLLSYVILIGGQINAILIDRQWIKEVLLDERG